MTLLTPKIPASRSLSQLIPPLESGDRLTRAEFARRYEAMPDLKKAELVEGVVFVASPVRTDVHGTPHAGVIGWLMVYSAATPGTRIGDNSTVGLDGENEYQPDAILMVESENGGQARLDKRGYIAGAPEFVAEIAATSASNDLNAKLNVYRRTKVREYFVWRTLEEELDWFVLRGDEFERQSPDPQGVLRSTVFPGLWLDSAALLRGNMAAVLLKLQEGLATPEHVAFAASLKREQAGT